MNDPVRAGEIIRVFEFAVFARESWLKPLFGLQENKADWYVGRKEDFREPFKNRTLALSEAWKKERDAKKALDEAKAKAMALAGKSAAGELHTTFTNIS